MNSDTPKLRRDASCPKCWKEMKYCLCEGIQSFPNKTTVLLLQHPQEARNPLGSARLTTLVLQNSVHRVGLSWPSLSKAVGRPVEARHWAVLFLGSLKESKNLREDLPLQVVGRGGKRMPISSLQGIVLLDGNWKQSKTLWWRNPWLLRLNRIVLNVNRPSAYGSLRRQPRKQCLSTIEAAAETLSHLGESAEISDTLNALFRKFLERAI